MGTVLTWLGILVALVLGAMIVLGVIPLDRYFEEYEEKRARERRSREPLGPTTRGPQTLSKDLPRR